MFLLRWLRWLRGWVRFEAEGGFPERVLNLTACGGPPLWDTRRRGTLLIASCYAGHYNRLRPVMRKTGMRMRLQTRHGIPFTLRRYRARWGMALGALLFCGLLFFFQQRIWVVQIEGASDACIQKITETVAALGIAPGMPNDGIDMNTLQLEALRALPEVAWLAVNLEGSIARVEVREWELDPLKPGPADPVNLVATRDGVILSIRVRIGQSAVRPGDAVAAGSILVSGIVEGTNGPLFRHAAGEIIARTQRTLTVSIATEQRVWQPTGRDIYRPSLQFFGLFIPLYTDGEVEGTAAHGIMTRSLTIGGVPLPVGYVQERYRLLSEQTVVLSQTQALAQAQEALRRLEETELAAADVETRSVSVAVQDGCVTLTGVYTCTEDITVESPILFDE